MKKTVILAALITLGLSHAPLQAGDGSAGFGTYSARGCIGCHGASGKQPIAANFPIIGGISADLISTSLTEYRSGERKDPTMNAMASALSDAEIANLAAYLSSQ